MECVIIRYAACWISRCAAYTFIQKYVDVLQCLKRLQTGLMKARIFRIYFGKGYVGADLYKAQGSEPGVVIYEGKRDAGIQTGVYSAVCRLCNWCR